MSICDLTACTGCEACKQVCPVDAISMVKTREGFYYPSINNESCINCKQCVKVCHINQNVKKHTPLFYMGWNKDEDVLVHSSSGGAFTALAKYVLEKGGVVFGAYMDSMTKQIYHIPVYDIFELDKLRMSKYYQGSLNNTYKDAKKLLDSNKFVLFSGTSCQIAGLLSFLGKQYNNLYTVDILCHGFTSEKVVASYISCKEKKYRKTIVDYKFRLKPQDNDWCAGCGCGVKYFFADGTNLVNKDKYDTFFLGFNDYLFLRDSCYQCKYSGNERISDFTIADYWGVTSKEVGTHEMKYGVSLILFNTEKAQNIITNLQNDMVLIKIDGKNAINNNQALVMPSSYNANRKRFFELINNKSFDQIIKRIYFNYLIRKRIKNGIILFLGEKRYNYIIAKIKRGNNGK